MNATLRIGSISGIPISIHASWLLVYALITWSLAIGYFPSAVQGVGAVAAWVSGLVAALLLFVSVLLHEFSHALMARAWGVGVRGITLHVFGGVSQLEGEPPSPRAEFLIAVVGPLTSFAIAAVLWAVVGIGIRAPTPRAIVTYLAFVNSAVGVFNLIPGFPLDGGRLLRAVLWWWKGALEPATYLASRIGVSFAFGLMALGAFQIFSGAAMNGFWLILIGLFLRGAADSSYAQLTLKEALGRIRVRDLMTREVVSVTAETTLEHLADRFWTHRFTSFPVVDGDGQLRGIATLDGLRGMARERWPDTAVSEVMHAPSDDLIVSPDTSVFDALQKASGNGVGRLAVLDGGRLVGYLSLKDITQAIALRGSPSGRQPAQRPSRVA